VELNLIPPPRSVNPFASRMPEIVNGASALRMRLLLPPVIVRRRGPGPVMVKASVMAGNSPASTIRPVSSLLEHDCVSPRAVVGLVNRVAQAAGPGVVQIGDREGYSRRAAVRVDWIAGQGVGA